MGVEEDFRLVMDRALRSLVAANVLPREVLAATYTVERPKRDGIADVACNAAMTMTKVAKMPPLAVAEAIAGALSREPVVRSVEVAKPGFLNIKLAPEAFHAVLADISRAGDGYGRGAAASGDRIHLEFVSANPTGPLLISHARGALVGDAVGRVLEAAGHLVMREYYVNDFGNQVRTFALSVLASARNEARPEGGYPGAYVDAVARELRRTHAAMLDLASVEAMQTDVHTDDLADLSRECVRLMLDGVPGDSDLPGIKSTLRSLGVHFDNFYSEESLHRWGRVASALALLDRGGFLKTLDDGAWVFQLPEGDGEADAQYLGENRDAKEKSASAQGGRVVRKSDGKTYTYFASDIAYHADKIARGYDRLITVLGADHHGYTARIRNVLTALGLPKERSEVLLFQLVSLMRDGKPYKMGKRLGNLITCDEVIEEIDETLGAGAGRDALRYFYLSRRTENPVELDVELAKKATLDNPAVYLQYGHARLCSILKKAKDEIGIELPAYDAALVAKLTHPLELEMLLRLGAFPRVIREAAREYAPSKVTVYLGELAQSFHSYYTLTKKDPILPPASMRAEEGWESRWDIERTQARLLWIDSIRRVYRAGLDLLGIRAPERMDRAAAQEDEP